ncbi:MAG: hypothetical protein AABX39_05945 [Nanoarchaeota archaeon]
MGFWRNLLGSAILSGSLLLPSAANAQQIRKPRIEREIKIDFADPEENFEANSNLWYSLDQVIGKETEVLYKNWRENFGKRLLGLAINGELIYINDFVSHEDAHNREMKRYGDATAKFEFNSLLELNKNVIRYKKYESTLEQHLSAVVAGLNQNEHNSYMTFKNNLDTLSVHDSVSFFMNKAYDLFYIVTGPAGETGGDPENYINFLNEQDISLTKKDYFVQAWLADLFSVQTADSLETIHHYLADGQLTKKPTRMYFGNIAVTPPLINHYLTTKGSFYNITSIVGATGKTSAELSFATPINFLGGGEVGNYRAGLQINNLRALGLKLSPSYHFDTNLSGQQTGYSAGLQINKSLRKNVDLRVKAEYNKDDLLENIVKGEDNGWNFVVGVDVRF